MEVSCLHLGFYLASWGMLRGSSDLLQRSARHLVPLMTATTQRALIWSSQLRSMFVVRSARSKHPTFWWLFAIEGVVRDGVHRYPNR